ncbi:hypothetical protein FOZ60_011690 [Perkinsus olseni]|uniref:Uncharacterized protein n=1 Tax=Perkinsus olseni TaxID=32597 RepID=A0A7J6ND23_PEROL|nr:hypothetical protein FOZ60_011690 [Perkinsus olseni]
MFTGIVAVVLAASTFIANAREGLTPGKYCGLRQIPYPNKWERTHACFVFDYSSPTKASLGYNSAAHLNIDLHYNGVEVTKDGRIILKRDGSVPSPSVYPFVETRFDLKVRAPLPQWPNGTEAVYVLPWDGFRIKLTKETCYRLPDGTDCSDFTPSPYRRALKPAVGHYEHLDMSRGEYARVFANFLEGNPGQLELGGYHTQHSHFYTGITQASLGPKDARGLQPMSFVSPWLYNAWSYFKARVDVFYDESRDVMLLYPELGSHSPMVLSK